VKARTNFEDVSIGDFIPVLFKGPLTTAHLMRWSAAIENWHKIHYDLAFAQNHDRLPGLLIHGSLKQQYIAELLKNWAGVDGWVWKIRFQFRAMNLCGERLELWGRIIKKTQNKDFGLVEIEFGILNGAQMESTPGTATVALPYCEGPSVPYPFIAPAERPEIQ
jgi:acyl dehydratase